MAPKVRAASEERVEATHWGGTRMGPRSCKEGYCAPSFSALSGLIFNNVAAQQLIV
jgi:hypothetical protein